MKSNRITMIQFLFYKMFSGVQQHQRLRDPCRRPEVEGGDEEAHRRLARQLLRGRRPHQDPAQCCSPGKIRFNFCVQKYIPQ